MIGVTCVPYDASSRVSGPAEAAFTWKQIIPPVNDPLLFRRERGSLLPELLQHRTRALLQTGRKPLLLGGDHSLTWSALLPIVSQFGMITVVHFDAHHDSYDGAQLNHYTIFDLVQRHLPVRVIGVGYRHEGEPAPAQLKED